MLIKIITYFGNEKICKIKTTENIIKQNVNCMITLKPVNWFWYFISISNELKFKIYRIMMRLC